MRSWFTAMPGETLSCVGCHEQQNTGPPNRPRSPAARRRRRRSRPGTVRCAASLSHREVQPVLDQHCVGCHNGQPRPDGSAHRRSARRPQDHATGVPQIAGHVRPGGRREVLRCRTPSCTASSAGPGIESDIHLLAPMEFHADTTELVQMLRKGHYGVQLDAEAWDRLVTWIDLNAPYHGTWTEIAGEAHGTSLSARAHASCGSAIPGIDDDPEAIPLRFAATLHAPSASQPPRRRSRRRRAATAPLGAAGWPFDAAEARRRQGRRRSSRSERSTWATASSWSWSGFPPASSSWAMPTGPADEQPACRGADRQAVLDGPLRSDQRAIRPLRSAATTATSSRCTATSSACTAIPLNRPRQPAVRCRGTRRHGLLPLAQPEDRAASFNLPDARPSGNTPAARAPPRRSPSATRTPTSPRCQLRRRQAPRVRPGHVHPGPPGRQAEQVRRLGPQGRAVQRRRLRLGRRRHATRRTPGACATCTATSGSGRGPRSGPIPIARRTAATTRRVRPARGPRRLVVRSAETLHVFASASPTSPTGPVFNVGFRVVMEEE